MVMTPTVRHEVNLGGVESLAVIERDGASEAMDKCWTPLPVLAPPSMCATRCNLVGDVDKLPRVAVDKNCWLGRHRIDWLSLLGTRGIA